MSDNASKFEPRENGRPPEPAETVLHLGSFVSPSEEPQGTEEGLTTIVAKAAAETMEQSPKPVVVPADGGSIPPQTMLGVVSYCYSKGVYASEDIGRELAKDPAIREATSGDVPRPEDIRRFRRLNREAIQATVEKALARARRKVVEAWSPSNPFRSSPAAGTSLESLPVDAKREGTTSFVRREASDRIDKSTFIDGMSM